MRKHYCTLLVAALLVAALHLSCGGTDGEEGVGEAEGAWGFGPGSTPPSGIVGALAPAMGKDRWTCLGVDYRGVPLPVLYYLREQGATSNSVAGAAYGGWLSMGRFPDEGPPPSFWCQPSADFSGPADVYQRWLCHGWSNDGADLPDLDDVWAGNRTIATSEAFRRWREEGHDPDGKLIWCRPNPLPFVLPGALPEGPQEKLYECGGWQRSMWMIAPLPPLLQPGYTPQSALLEALFQWREDGYEPECLNPDAPPGSPLCRCWCVLVWEHL